MNEREFNQIFSERLKFYLKKYDMTQKDLAKRLGVGTTSIYNWLNAIKTPRMEKVDAMCEIFNCRRSDLTNEVPLPESCIKIPVLGCVTAGIPIDMVTDIIGTEEIPESMARAGEYFGLRIKGDSMTPDICDGDIVIVRQQSTADSGDIVIASINGREATCKRLKIYKNGIELRANNPSCESYDFSADEVDRLPVNIIGKVVELRRRF